MTRFVCLVLLALSVAAAGDTLVPTYPPKWNAGRVAAETGAGLLGGAGGALAGGLAGVAVAYATGVNSDAEFGSLMTLYCAIIGGAIAYPFGTAGGVSWMGRRFEERGSYWAGLLGSCVGVGACIGVARLTRKGDLGFIAVAVAPVVGSAGYNLSRPRVPAGNAPINRVGPPSFSYAPVAGERQGAAFDARLLTVRF